MKNTLRKMDLYDLLLMLNDEHYNRYRSDVSFLMQQGISNKNSRSLQFVKGEIIDRIMSYPNYIERAEVLRCTTEYADDLIKEFSKYPSITDRIELLEEHLDIYENMLEELKNLERREYE